MFSSLLGLAAMRGRDSAHTFLDIRIHRPTNLRTHGPVNPHTHRFTDTHTHGSTDPGSHRPTDSQAHRLTRSQRAADRGSRSMDPQTRSQLPGLSLSPQPGGGPLGGIRVEDTFTCRKKRFSKKEQEDGRGQNRARGGRTRKKGGRKGGGRGGRTPPPEAGTQPSSLSFPRHGFRAAHPENKATGGWGGTDPNQEAPQEPASSPGKGSELMGAEAAVPRNRLFLGGLRPRGAPLGAQGEGGRDAVEGDKGKRVGVAPPPPWVREVDLGPGPQGGCSQASP